MNVRSFLRTAEVLRHFVQDFERIAAPLTRLLVKNRIFEFEEEERNSMKNLKTIIVKSRAIRSIDYECNRSVHICIDSSIIDYDEILLQIEENGERMPARFFSGT